MVVQKRMDWKAIISLLVFGLAALALLPLGCQEPIQPTDLTVPTDVIVRVEDGNGAPISNATVEFTLP